MGVVVVGVGVGVFVLGWGGLVVGFFWVWGGVWVLGVVVVGVGVGVFVLGWGGLVVGFFWVLVVCGWVVLGFFVVCGGVGGGVGVGVFLVFVVVCVVVFLLWGLFVVGGVGLVCFGFLVCVFVRA
ncbi:hypothetical protein, partial [Enterobacter hormaechei]|uniref:hypothetical protein n=1 Tax=Enterobacter hormaechei TaxID=158836 RepID=UPI00197AB75C